jgi:tRNA(ile)-lysidine synthase
MVYDRMKQTVLDHQLIEDGDGIVVGLSGGPDSVCLLHTLYRLSKEKKLKIYAVHLNHMIRGLDAFLDSLYVMKLCQSLYIPCFIRTIDVPKYCQENKLGLEDGARRLRYQVFSEVRDRLGAKKIAIGHNKNDQAETILMRIMRGTGLQGLRGIEYKRKDGVIRPILDIDRESIETYCMEHKLLPRIDSSNLEPIYSRNKIRLKILPYMKSEFNDNIVDSIVRMGDSLRVDSDYINFQVDKIAEYAVKTYKDGSYIFVDYIKDAHPAIKTRIVIRAIRNLLGNVTSIEKKHIDEVLDLMPGEKRYKKIDLPRGLHAYRFADYILMSQKEIKVEDVEYDYKINPGTDQYIEEIDKTLKTRLISQNDFDRSNFKSGKQYLDFDKIKDHIRLRNRRQGDKIKLLGGTKKVKDLFIGLKVPREERSFVPFVVNNDTVVSIYGYRINVDYKVDDDTKRILEISID